MSCKTASISLEQGFKERSDFYSIEGKNGWQLNQVIRFGPFETSKIDRSMTFSYHVPLLIDFSGGKENIAFNLYDRERQAGLSFIGDSRPKDVHLSSAKGYFQVPIDQRDVFAGAMIFSQPEVRRYDFFLLNPNDQQLNARCQGVVLKDGREHFIVKGTTKLAGSRIPQTEVFGYEIYRRDQLVAAVETINRGAIWMDSALAQDDRMLVAALSTGLLVRTNLREGVENL